MAAIDPTTTAKTAAKTRAPRAPRRAIRQSRAAWVLTGPALGLMVLLLLAPVSIAAFLSFTNYSLGNSGFDWVGFDNYEKLFTRSTYDRAIESVNAVNDEIAALIQKTWGR